MFERPSTDEQLLRNLKIAFDKALIAEPAFATDAILLKLFAGNSVRRKPEPPAGNRFDEMEIVVSVEDAHLPRMAVRLQQGLSKVDQAGQATFSDPVRIIRFGRLDVDFPAGGRATVATVYEVFGKENQVILGSEPVSESGGIPARPSKGHLFYGDPRDADFAQTSLVRGRAVFFLDPAKPPRSLHDNASWAQLSNTLFETDTIAHIFFYIPAP
jgi:hypothetical protein